MKYFFYSLTIIVVLFASCTSKTKSDKQILIYSLKGPSGISMVKMAYDAEKDTNYLYKFLDEPEIIKTAILQNIPDIAVIPTTLAALLYNKGCNYQMLSCPVWGTLYLFGTDTSVHQWSDLKGKKVYLMTPGMTPDVAFRFILKQNGLNENTDLLLDYTFPSHMELARAVASGRAPLAVISEPLVSLIKSKNKAVRTIFDIEKEWNKVTHDSIPFAQTAVMVKMEFAKKYPNAISNFTKEYALSCDWVNKNPAQASHYIKKFDIFTDTAVIVNAIPNCAIRYVEASIIKEGINKYLQVFYHFNEKIIGGKLPDEKFYYNE